MTMRGGADVWIPLTELAWLLSTLDGLTRPEDNTGEDVTNATRLQGRLQQALSQVVSETSRMRGKTGAEVARDMEAPPRRAEKERFQKTDEEFMKGLEEENRIAKIRADLGAVQD